MLIYFIFGITLQLINAATIKSQPRKIIGGNTVKTPHMYPFALEIRERGRHSCGAALIKTDSINKASRWALTAAHCVCINNSATKYQDLKIYAGKHLTNLPDKSQSFQILEDKNIICHPQFSDDVTIHGSLKAKRAYNDIALIMLPRHFLFFKAKNQNIGTIEFENNPRREILRDCKVIGWGFTQEQPNLDPSALQELVVETYDPERYKSFGEKFYNEKTEHCYGIPNPSVNIKRGTPCGGDSGAPVLCNINRKIVLIGIHSATGLCKKKVPLSIAVRVGVYYNWINQVIENQTRQSI